MRVVQLVRILMRGRRLRGRLRRVRIMMMEWRDRFGLTWHPAIAAGVLAHIDRIDLVEVIPEGLFLDSRRARRALRRLARTLPVSIHGVSLGLATVAPIDANRLDLLARLVGDVEPESWSEHLAFVRAGGIELGHLAAPPRTALSVEAVAEHVEQARRAIGTYPSLENVATPIDPPGSDRAEMPWLLDVLKATPAGLLLDLHNLYANGTNFGVDPAAMLAACPADRIRTIHIAGGVNVHACGEVRVIDDHLHDVPDPVYDLLEMVGERVPHPVDVMLERDGAFPPIEALLAQLDRARAALARGRTRLQAATDKVDVDATRSAGDRITAGAHRQEQTGSALLERLLARVYTDDRTRARFVAAPLTEAMNAGLSLEAARAIQYVDETGLTLAAASFARKRRAKGI
jgi:uncharacterized protein (UPF0276 family)